MRHPKVSEENKSPLPSWPKLLQNNSLEHFFFVIIFAVITKIIPPEHFLCNVAATGLSLLARNMLRNLLCKVIVLIFLK